MPSSLKGEGRGCNIMNPSIYKDWRNTTSPAQKPAKLIFSSKRKTSNSRNSWIHRKDDAHRKEWDLVNATHSFVLFNVNRVTKTTPKQKLQPTHRYLLTM